MGIQEIKAVSLPANQSPPMEFTRIDDVVVTIRNPAETRTSIWFEIDLRDILTLFPFRPLIPLPFHAYNGLLKRTKAYRFTPHPYLLYTSVIRRAMKGGKSKAAETKKADTKLSVKRGATAAAGKKPAKKGKTAKDPNKPKRPASAFFVFMEEFRKQYKEKHPNNKSVAAVGKAGGDKWKSLSDAEKAPYIAKAEKRKVEYEKNLQAYNKKINDGAADEESDKSKSEVNDEDEDEEADDGEDDDDDE